MKNQTTLNLCASALIATLSWTCHAFDIPPSEGEPEPMEGKPGERPWSFQRHWSFLPLWAKAAHERGHELPLPLGVSFVYNYLERDINVDDVRLSVNGQPLQSVSRFLNLGSSSKVDGYLMKVDAWVLPFLNVYVLGGYLQNDSTSKGRVTLPPLLPGQPPRVFDFTARTSLDGYAAGGGGTLAVGYKQIFLMVDANYSEADMEFDERFTAITASSRVGWHGKIGSVPVRVWAGGAYWETENTAKSTVSVPNVGTIKFEADQGPRNPWNGVVGTSVVLHRRWDVFFEYGFNFDDVNIVATGLTVRF